MILAPNRHKLNFSNKVLNVHFSQGALELRVLKFSYAPRVDQVAKVYFILYLMKFKYVPLPALFVS